MRGRSRRRLAWGLAVLFTMIFAGRVHAAGEVIPETGPWENSPGFPGTEENGRVHLDIDSRYKYEGMEQSFSEGYQPVVKDGVLHLVIPFTASGELAGNRLSVSLTFPDGAAPAFLPRNYQKTVEKRRYTLRGGTMVCTGTGGQTEAPGQTELSGQTVLPGQTVLSGEEDRETYLYCMEIPLSGADISGSCSLTVQAVGYTERMEQVSLKRQILFSLLEGGKPGGADRPGDKNGGSGEGGAGDEAGGSGNGDDTGNEDGSGNGDGTGKGTEPGEDGAAPGENGSGGGFGAGGGSEAGGGGEELIRQPKLLFKSNNLSGRKLAAGSRETFTVTFRNCSGSQPLYNLKAVASAQTQGVGFSKNSFYVAKAAPGEDVVLETELTVALDAPCGESPVIFEFEYEDKKGNPVSGKETVVLSVGQEAELQCQTGEVPGVLYATDTMELSLKACNTGRAPVYNVQASLSAEGLSSDGEVFLGNLEAGAQGEGTMRIYAGGGITEAAGTGEGGRGGEKYGPVEGTITFRYEDGDGEIYEETMPFRTEIKKAEIVSFAVEEPEETNSWWVSAAAVSFAGLILWILLLLFRLRKKNALLAERRRTE